MTTCCIIVPYFGPWPPWFPIYLKSCGYNPGINWLIVGDAQLPPQVPQNVSFLSISFEQFLERVSRKLGIKTDGIGHYKICDFKPAYGEIFAEEIAGYDFFGWGDIDLVYGQIEKLVTPLLEDYDIFSFQTWELFNIFSNHTCLVRRTPRLVSLFRESPVWREKMETLYWAKFDDIDFTHLVQEEPRCWMHECYSTPFGKIPWSDGTNRFPTRFTWNRGVLTTNLDPGYQLAYFHFMVWKASKKDVLETFKQWPVNPLINFKSEDCSNQDDTYLFTNEGITYKPLRPPNTALPLLYDQTAPKLTLINKVYKKLWRKIVGHLGRGLKQVAD